MTRILVTGGAGFIGKGVVKALANQGAEITVIDRDPSTWCFNSDVADVLPMDYADYFVTEQRIGRFDAVVHLAAEHLVEKSVTEPAEYYTNNVVKTKVMLDNMLRLGIKNILFSSSGNVYGRQGANGPLTEDLYYDPENPYASSKVTGEMMIKDYAKAYGLNYLNFRYFNAAGADPEGRFGYTQTPATHVIPILCRKIMEKTPFVIFGDDYPTVDGTCVRDYVHVADIAEAHVLGINYLLDGGASKTLNLGGGAGVSVQQLAACAGTLLGEFPLISYAPRRAGDPAKLTANIKLAADTIGWKPQYDVSSCILHAWHWEKKLNG